MRTASKSTGQPMVGALYDLWIVAAPLAVLLATVFAGARPVLGQLAIRGGFGPAFPQVAVAEGDEDDEFEFSDGPNLATDSDIERLIRRAHDHVVGQRYDLATLALQKTLDDEYRQNDPLSAGASVSNLTTLPEWITSSTIMGKPIKFQLYRSVTFEVERMLRELPPAGLRMYRLSADGRAKGLIAVAEGDQREARLDEVVRRFFMSSEGDNAAFQLACLRLENRDYVSASRLLRKVLEEHPDPSIAREDLLVRLAFAEARLGDGKRAQDTLKELDKLERRALSDRSLALVRREMAHVGDAASGDTLAGWPMPHGNPSRTGTMTGLKLSSEGSQLWPVWREPYRFHTGLSESGGGEPSNTGGGQTIQAVRNGRVVRIPVGNDKTVRSLQELADRWRESNWVPAGGALVDGDRLYVTAYEVPPSDARSLGHDSAEPGVCLICVNAQTGQMQWRIPWSYDRVGGSRLSAAQRQQINMIRARMGQSGVNVSDEEAAMFQDRVPHCISIVDDWVIMVDDGPMSGMNVPVQLRTQRGMSQQPEIGNKLIAWDKVTGKFQWERIGDPDPENDSQPMPVRFVAAPVPHGKQIVVPARYNGELWLYCLRPHRDPATGQLQVPTVWKTRLCDEPQGGINPSATVGVATDGGDVYVASGAGVVFAVDGATGSVRWVVRYPRSGDRQVLANRQMMMMRGVYSSLASNVTGWSVDTAVLYRGWVIVFPSDNDNMLAFDRRDGSFVWAQPRSETDGVDGECREFLGIADEMLIVGGPGVIRGHSLRVKEDGKVTQGNLIWKAPAEAGGQYLGCAAVTSEGIFVPVNDTIVRLSLHGGKRDLEFHVPGMGNLPLGNLVSDGQRLVALGPERLMVLTSLEQRMKDLDAKIAAGDFPARLDRIELLDRLKRPADALRELDAAVELKRKQEGDAAAGALLVDVSDRLELVGRSPHEVLERLIAVGGDPKSLTPDQQGRRTAILQAGLKTLSADRSERTLPLVLKLLPHLKQRHLQVAARDVLRTIAGRNDVAVLRTALESPQEEVRATVVAVLGEVLGADARDILRLVLDDPSERLRLTAARALADADDRTALDALVALLGADDAPVRTQAASTLRALTGQQFDFIAYAPEADRAAASERWRTWVKEQGASAKLNTPLRESGLELGRLLLCRFMQEQALELTGEGEAILQVNDLRGAWGCQGLPNGHRLLVSSEGRQVIELDERGNVVWRKDSLAGSPTSVRRLRNENTLMAFPGSGKGFLLEVDFNPELKDVWKVDLDGAPVDAERLDNGLTLVALNQAGKIVEIDRDGRVDWTIDVAGGPRSVQRLADGNTLVAEENSNRVVEYDRSGKAVWKLEDLRAPRDAQRLASGATLVADANGVREYDRSGKQVREIKLGDESITDVSRLYAY